MGEPLPLFPDPPTEPAEAPAVRMFDPPDSGEDIEQTIAIRIWTLGSVYQRLQRPEIVAEGRSPKTLADHLLHLGRFAEFWQSAAPGMKSTRPKLWESWGMSADLVDALRDPRITNPRLSDQEEGICPVPVDKVDRQHLVIWRSWLTDKDVGLKLSARSANKYIGTIQAVLSAARDHGIVAAPPRVRMLKHKRAAAKLYLSLEQLGALYDACSVACWPTHSDRKSLLPFAPPAYWRAALVLFFTKGFRTQELIAYEPRKRALTWRNVYWQRETPSDEGQAVNEHGWLAYVPQKQERHKPEPLVLPISAVTAAHLRSIEPPNGADPDRRVFPLPGNKRSLYATWEAICTAAGAKPKRGLDGVERFYELQHLRKTCETHYNLHRRGIAPFVTGHADRSGDSVSVVAATHYDNPEEALVEAINTLPVPPQFLTIFDAGDRQRLLF